ncbi:alcohol dehydrogenase catalytic domain-containing protein [Brachybacterium paraconglomeratum]|uniref:alcohol dehydrogenase catalytic domain-containing protein n=1 Tax=Brachybacterium paraconglomeratum TaxID=173362 RepID=UPI00380C5373
MTRTVRFHETGGPEVLRLDELDAPVPGPSEVVIDVAALGINRAEVDFRKGEYVVDPVLPSGIGYEAAGTVREVGSDVDHVAVGDAVSVVPAFQLTEYGVHGEGTDARVGVT